MSFYPWFVMAIVVLILRCNGQNYICDDENNNKPVCECEETECYFKLVIDHAQVTKNLCFFFMAELA